MSITTTERAEILKLLALMFNATPGATYLSQIVSMYEGLGRDLAALANTLDDLPVYATLNPNFLTAEEFAAKFLTPLGLQDDALSLSFVIDKFNAGVPKGQIAYEAMMLLNAVDPGGPSQYVAAKAILANKAAVSEYFSVTLGVNVTDFATLLLVLNGVTADPESVTDTLEQIDSGTLGTNGIEAVLTPSQDNVVGSASSDIVNGLFGDATAANNTYTAGDSIDGAAGMDRLNLVALGTAASTAVTVRNVEIINIQDTVGATFNALLVEDAPAINFGETVVGQASTVTGAAQASVVSLSGAGNLTVGYADTAGSSDTANVALNGVGTSAAARSTVNVGNTNTIEMINVAATGTNFVTLTGGSVAGTLTITGDGTNNFSLSAADSLAAVTTIDASASTGANTFAMGGNLNTGITVKGGTGADTLSATLSSATLVGPVTSAVETFSAAFAANAAVDLGSAVGLTAVTTSAAAGSNMNFQNALTSVGSVAVTSATAANLTFGYDPAGKGNLALAIGSSAATATEVALGTVTLANTESVTIGTLGAFDHEIDTATIDGDQDSVSLVIAEDSSLGLGNLNVDGDVAAFSISLAADGSFSGYTTIDGSLASSSLSAAAGADAVAFLTADEIGEVTITATGDDAGARQMIFGQDVGDITATGNGDDIDLGLFAISSGGSIGDLSLSLTGDDGNAGLLALAVSSGGDASHDIGNVAVSLAGDGIGFSGYATAAHGDVGDLAVSVAGSNSDARFEVTSVFRFMDVDGDESTDDYAFGGNVGNISLAVDGTNAEGTLQVTAVGGNVGAISASIQGDGAEGGIMLRTITVPFSGAPAADMGNFTLSVGDNASFSGYFTAFSGGSMGDISIDVGQDAYVNLDLAFYEAAIGTTGITAADGAAVHIDYQTAGSGGSGGSGGGSGFPSGLGDFGFVSARASSGGDPTTVGDVTATFGNDGHLGMSVSGAYDFGNITATFGDGGSFSGYWTAVGGGGGARALEVLVLPSADPTVVGDIDMTFGDDGRFGLDFAFSSHVDVGNITVDFGDDGDFEFSQIFHSDGDVGDVTATFGNGGGFNFAAMSGGGSGLVIGDISLAFGTGASAGFFISPASGASYASIGEMTLTGGDAGSNARVELGASGLWVGAMGGVDASAWLGSVDIDLSAVALGTTIRVGADGSFVRGGEGPDNVFLGAGVDIFSFDTSPTSVDSVFGFTAGVGKDQLQGTYTANFATNTHTVNEADTLQSGDAAKLTDIAAGNDITTAAGLLAALNAGGEYALIDSTAGGAYTIFTAASASATTFYVFNAVGNGATAEFDTVTLVGVVSSTTAFSSLAADNLFIVPS